MASNGAPMREPNYETRAPGLIAESVICIVIPTIAVFIRFWSRLVIARSKWWWDDTALLLTLIFSNVQLATVFFWVHYGFGTHSWMIPMENIRPILLITHLYVVWYNTVITLLKLSALSLYARLFRVSQKMSYILWSLGALIVAWWIALMIVPWLNCRPLGKTLDPFIPGTCYQRTSYHLAIGIINPILDFTILFLPMPMVWRIHMKTSKKILVSLIFLIGYCSAFLSLGRFIMIVREPWILSNNTISDPTWVDVPLILVSSLEAPVAIVALSGQPVNQFIKRAKQFGWRSLLTVKSYPSNDAADDHVNQSPARQGSGESTEVGFMGVLRKKVSSRIGRITTRSTDGLAEQSRQNSDSEEKFQGPHIVTAV